MFLGSYLIFFLKILQLDPLPSFKDLTLNYSFTLFQFSKTFFRRDERFSVILWTFRRILFRFWSHPQKVPEYCKQRLCCYYTEGGTSLRPLGSKEYEEGKTTSVVSQEDLKEKRDSVRVQQKHESTLFAGVCPCPSVVFTATLSFWGCWLPCLSPNTPYPMASLYW